MSRKRLSKKELANFSRQLGQMFESGITLAVALDVLAEDPAAPFASVAKELLFKIERGHSLSNALSTSESEFPKSLIVLCKIGEETGTLGKTLPNAADWLEDDYELVQSVKNALTYPAIVVFVSMILTVFLFTTVVPKLLQVAESLGGELPLPTRVIQFLCQTLSEPGFWTAPAGIILLVAYNLSDSSKRAATYREFLHRRFIEVCKLVPVLSPTLVAFYHARFCAGFSILIEQGVEVLRAINLSQDLTQDPEILADKKGFRERVQGGESLTDAMAARSDIYHGMLISFIALGEESASLGKAVSNSGRLYRMMVDEKLAVLKQTLEPLLTVGVGLLIGFVLLATMLPLYSVLTKL